MSWLDDASANRINKCYMKNFLDVSGNLKVRYVKNETIELPASFTQIGATISSLGSYITWMSMNNDGTIIAVPGVRVYQRNGNIWNQLGTNITDNGDGGGTFGTRLALSGDGTRIAIGSRFADVGGTNRGYTRTYDWNGTSWVHVGGTILGEAANDWSGWGVALSDDGNRLAVGATQNDGGSGANGGHIRVFNWNGSSWSRLGQDMDGHSNEEYGGSVAINHDGTVVIGGAVKNRLNSNDTGRIAVYQLNGNSWSLKGSNIYGSSANVKFGHDVAVNSDGTIIAVGSVGYNGRVDVYQWNGSDWAQMGNTLVGGAHNDYFGNSVRLSADGTILVVGSPMADLNGSSSGYMAIFSWDGSSWNQLGDNILGSRSKRAGWTVAISNDGRFFASLWGGSGSRVKLYEMSGGSSEIDINLIPLDVSGGTINMFSNTMDVSSGVVDISGTSWMNRGQSSATIADAYQCGLVIESSTTSTDDAVLYVETAGQAQAFSVRGDGATYADNTLEHSSDDRRKINEQHITNATETIMKLSPQIYTKLDKFEAHGGKPMKTESGLIAQEIYYNAPELQHLVNIDMRTFLGERWTPDPYDVSGNDIQNDPDYTALNWGNKTAYVNYIGLIPYLIKSTQEQNALISERQTMIDQQKELIQQFQDRLTALENK